MTDISGYKVSVIVPVYNKQSALEKCLDSILNQTYKNLEIILVDDGSTDESGKICDAYAVRDHRVKTVHQQNGGAGAARNRGIDNASGSLLFFVDADDYLDEKAAEILVSCYDKNKCDLTVGTACFMQDGKVKERKGVPQDVLWNKHEIRECVKRTLLDPKNNDFFHRVWGRIFVAAIVKQKNIRFSSIRNGQDCQFSYDYLYYAENAFLTNQVVYYYDIYAANSLSSMVKKKISPDDYKMFQPNNVIFNSMKKMFPQEDNEAGDMDTIKKLFAHAKVYTYISVLIRYCRQARFDNFFAVRDVVKKSIAEEGILDLINDYQVLGGNSQKIPDYIRRQKYTRLVLEAKKCGERAFGKVMH